MRILPVALVGRSLPESELVEWACRSSKITHAHPRSQIACAIYCLMVGSLLGGMEPEPALEHSLDAARQALPAGHADELIELRRYRQRSGGGYVLDCLWSAVDAFQSSSDYRTTVVRAIEFGNDTDTTAAVAGGLAGAHWGVPSIPQEWIQQMRGGEIVIPLIERLTAGLGA